MADFSDLVIETHTKRVEQTPNQGSSSNQGNPSNHTQSMQHSNMNHNNHGSNMGHNAQSNMSGMNTATNQASGFAGQPRTMDPFAKPSVPPMADIARTGSVSTAPESSMNLSPTTINPEAFRNNQQQTQAKPASHMPAASQNTMNNNHNHSHSHTHSHNQHFGSQNQNQQHQNMQQMHRPQSGFGQQQPMRQPMQHQSQPMMQQHNMHQQNMQHQPSQMQAPAPAMGGMTPNMSNMKPQTSHMQAPAHQAHSTQQQPSMPNFGHGMNSAMSGMSPMSNMNAPVANNQTAQSSSTNKGRRNDKRERLIQAADQLIYHKTFHTTTLADIAKLADVPLGNVYYYFKTKEAIMDAVLNQRINNWRNLFDKWDNLSSPKEKLIAMLEHSIESAETTSKFGCVVGSLCQEVGKQGGQMSQAAAKLMTNMINWAQKQFTDMGKGEQSLGLAEHFIASIQGISLLTLTFRKPEFMGEQSKLIKDWIMGL